MRTFYGKRVLITGDSHVDWSPFGVQLEARLREAGATVVRLGIGASSARSWTRGEPVCRTLGGERRCLTVADLRAQGPYDLAIIALGTNDAANAHAEGANLAQAALVTASRLRQHAQAIGAPETWIVGPPRMGRTSGHYTDQTMAPVAEACASAFQEGAIQFVDSRAVPKTDGDGVHVGRRGGEAWSAYVVQQIQSSGARAINRAAGDWIPVALVALGGLSLAAFIRRVTE
jgi:lysophospholipase L1-like esterase